MLWVAGIAELATGAAFDGRALVASGWLDLLVAATLLSVNVLASLRAAAAPLALPARLVAMGQAFLPAGLFLALVATVDAGTMGPFSGSARPALATLLVAGWIGLTVAGSLLHLLALLARVRDLRRRLSAPRPVRDRAIAVTAGAGVIVLALSHAPSLAALATPGTAALSAAAVVVAGHVLALALRGLLPTRS